MTKEELIALTPSYNHEKLESLMEITLSTNEKFNLTAIKEPCDFRELMIYDSLLPLKHFSFDDKNILDVGTGAGFPGLPLAISSRGKFTLLDSTKKKIDHINNVVKELEINNVISVNARVEELAHEHKEEFDYVIARAVASLPILIELCLPLCKVGGYFLAMKSTKADEEIKNSQNALKKLNGEISDVYIDTLPSGEQRNLIVIKKIKVSNNKYPRRYEQIKRLPL